MQNLLASSNLLSSDTSTLLQPPVRCVIEEWLGCLVYLARLFGMAFHTGFPLLSPTRHKSGRITVRKRLLLNIVNKDDVRGNYVGRAVM